MRNLLTFDHPEQNHDGGWIAFSPRPNDDHNLYVATGDGGNGNDQDGNVGLAGTVIIARRTWQNGPGSFSFRILPVGE